MRYFDSHPSILEWASEEFSIPYISPKDNKVHRYFPDFYVKKRKKCGTVVHQVIEVKPAHQCAPPKKPKRQTPKYITEVFTWGVNSAKWKAARKFCEARGMEFVIVTEKELGIK